MAIRFTKQAPAIVLLVPLFGLAAVVCAGCARDQSLRQSTAGIDISPISSSRGPAAARRDIPGSKLTYCSGSNLEWPDQLVCNEENHPRTGRGLFRFSADGSFRRDRRLFESMSVSCSCRGDECRCSEGSSATAEPQCVTTGAPCLDPSSCTVVSDAPRAPPSMWPPAYGPACISGCEEQGGLVTEPPPLLRWDGSRVGHLGDHCRELPAKVCNDYKNFYSCTGMRGLLLGVGAAAVLANTSLDQDFRDWYQERVQNDETDRFGNFWNYWGDGTYVLPAVLAVGAAGAMFDDTPAGAVCGEFGDRAVRAYLVGGPLVVFGQWALGGSRPGKSDHGSRWEPFQDTHAISGHAFIGAVPLITAAQMSDCLWVKGGLYGLSVLPGWARVNRDKHYLSQAILGWWIACLSCSAVNQTELSEKGYTIFPVVSSDTVGVGVMCPW